MSSPGLLLRSLASQSKIRLHLPDQKIRELGSISNLQSLLLSLLRVLGRPDLLKLLSRHSLAPSILVRLGEALLLQALQSLCPKASLVSVGSAHCQSSSLQNLWIVSRQYLTPMVAVMAPRPNPRFHRSFPVGTRGSVHELHSLVLTAFPRLLALHAFLLLSKQDR